MIWRHQFFVTGNFDQWHGYGNFSVGRHHDAILFLCYKVGTGSTKPGGQQPISSRWRAAALQMTEDGDPGFESSQFFQLSG